MNKVVDDIYELHREIDEMLEEKLRGIDRCIEEGVQECPCGKGSCEITSEKFDEVDRLYSELLKDEELRDRLEEAENLLKSNYNLLNLDI